MQREGCICVFAKPAEAGKVKTRLIPVAGSDGAAALANAFLQDTWATVCRLPWAKAVIASTDTSISSLVSSDSEIWLQGEGDLGARLERILKRGLETSAFAIAIGADTPGLPSSFLEQARFALRHADAVIGPSEDGGFYLLALRRCPTGLLAGIPWSQTNTFAQTLAKLKAAGLDVRLLDPWFDVDWPEDLERLKALAASGRIHVPKTRQTLERILIGGETKHAPKLSVIIPVLNERECLPLTLSALRGHDWIHELLVVDGGSTDGTQEWLDRNADERVKLVHAERGRGRQLNAGAAVATGDVFLFLHADCLLPCDAGKRLRQALGAETVAGGCFCVRFTEERPRSLALVAAGINMRTRIARRATGDQAIFVRRRIFEAIGGFHEWPLCEDVDFVGRLKRAGKFVVVRSPVTISARRHLRYGVFRHVMLVYMLRIGFWAGISPFTLARLYGDGRSGENLPAPMASGGGEAHLTKSGADEGVQTLPAPGTRTNRYGCGTPTGSPK